MLGGIFSVARRWLSTRARTERWTIAVLGTILITTTLVFIGSEYYTWTLTFTVDYSHATAPQYALPYFLTRVWVWIGAAIFMITVVALAPGDQDDLSN